MRLPLTLLFIALASTGSADKRGQVVCGIPPDEAVAYVYESKSGVWDYIGPLARIVGDMGHPSVEAAVARYAPEQAEYVCDVEILAGQLRLIHTARLYRLHHPFIPQGAVNEYGEPLDYDYDPREDIVGVPEATEAEEAPPLELDRSGCLSVERQPSPEFPSLTNFWFTNNCAEDVLLRYCRGPRTNPRNAREAGPECGWFFVRAGRYNEFSINHTVSRPWSVRWDACLMDWSKDIVDQVCHFAAPQQ